MFYYKIIELVRLNGHLDVLKALVLAIRARFDTKKEYPKSLIICLIIEKLRRRIKKKAH